MPRTTEGLEEGVVDRDEGFALVVDGVVRHPPDQVRTGGKGHPELGDGAGHRRGPGAVHPEDENPWSTDSPVLPFRVGHCRGAG